MKTKYSLDVKNFLFLDAKALEDFQKKYFLDAVGSGKFQVAIVDKKTKKVRGLLWRLKARGRTARTRGGRNARSA